MILIELTKGFNLRRMTLTRSHSLKSYYETYFYDEIVNFWAKNIFFLDIVSMFWEHVFEVLSPPLKVFSDIYAFAEHHAFGMVIPSYTGKNEAFIDSQNFKKL